MIWILTVVGVCIAGPLVYAQLALSRANLARFDGMEQPPESAEPLSKAYRARIVQLLSSVSADGSTTPQLSQIRAVFDSMGDGDFGVDIIPTTADGVPAEWVLPPDGRSDHRLLYIHGGGFYIGSAKSHRRITSEIAKRTGCSVLSISYRLMPEHKRSDTIEDAQKAYRWILRNGPNTNGPPSFLAVAGDSAGGNLALMVVAWARNEGLLPAHAVVGLAPATDSGFQSPSLKENVDTDLLLGPVLGKAMKLPAAFLFLMNWAGLRIQPSNPIVSPLRGDLSSLPPTLLQVSSSEMLRDDSVRYHNKANAAGSPTILQHWPDRAHVWHAIGSDIPEVQEAFDKIEKFISHNMACIVEEAGSTK